MEIKKYTRMYLVGITTLIMVGYTYASQDPLVATYLNNLRSVDSGQIGYILGEIFNTSGKIKQDYLDLPAGLVVSDASTSVTGIVMLESNTGSTASLTKAATSNIVYKVRDAIQTQLGTKQDKAIGAATTIMTGNLVAERVLVSDINQKVAASTVTSAELRTLTGVTSNIQAQLNAKLSSSYTAPVTSVAGKTGIVTLTKGDVGLGNVDNTTDLAKPISTLTQAALDGKVTSNAAITAGTATKITYDTKGLITGGTALTEGDIPNLDWSKITTGKPTTLAGYGITDGASSVPSGTHCGFRTVYIARSNGSINYGTNYPCFGSTLTATKQYNISLAGYIITAVSGCPTGYTTLTTIPLTLFYPEAVGIFCIKN